MKKNVYIIAGPNGSGKTTFAKEFLPRYAHCPNFVNADLIAQGLSPFSPEIAAMKAGRLLRERIYDLASKNVDFAFETTLSGKTYITFLRRLKGKGYLVHLFFLWIPNAELALTRIRQRVKNGGHIVPEMDVRRRFNRSIHNFFEFYRPLVDLWNLFDNSTTTPRLVAKEEYGSLEVLDSDLFDKIIKKAGNNGQKKNA